MTLKPEHSEVPVTVGLNETTNREGAPAGMLELENWTWQDADSISRRNGFQRVATWTAYREKGLALAGNGIAAIGGQVAYPFASSYGLQAGVNSYTTQHESMGTIWEGERIYMSDCAVVGDQYLIAVAEFLETPTTSWAGTVGRRISWRLVDGDTWVTRKSGTITGSGTGAWGPRIVADSLGTGFILAWQEGSFIAGTCTIKYFSLTAAGVLGATVTVDSNAVCASTAVSMDMQTHPSGGDTYIAYVVSGTNIKLARVNPSAVVSTFSDAASPSVGGAVAVVVKSANVVVIYNTAATTEGSTYDLNITAKSAGTAGIAPIFAGAFMRNLGAVSNGAATTTTYVVCDDATTGGVQVGSYTLSGGPNTFGSFAKAMLATKPWKLDTGTVACGITPSNAATSGYRTILVADILDQSIYGQFAFDECGVLTSNFGGGLSGVATQDDDFITAVPVTLESADAVSSGFPEVCRARVVKLTTSSQMLSKASLGGYCVVSGSLPRIWDGKGLRPAAFHVAPEAPTLSISGASTMIGLYSYRVVLEFTDNSGNIQLSPPSEPSSITLASQGVAVALVFPLIPQAVPVRCKLYRTEAGGSVYHLVRVFLVDGSTTVTDTLADTQISDFEVIYSTNDPGGALSSELAPPLRYVTAHRNRLFGISADNPRTIRFTQETTDAQLPRWNAALTFQVDNTAGNPTALASLDDKLLIFQRDQIVAVTGPGPDGLGVGSFSFPEVVARGVGVDSDNMGSVVVVPQGVIFRHQSGIYMIDRSLQVTPIGLPVQRTVGTSIIESAKYLAAVHQVWFFFALPTRKAVVVYDVRWNRWTTYDGPWTFARDAIEADGQCYILDAQNDADTAALWRYEAGLWNDIVGGVGSYYDQTVSFPWFRPAEHNGELRLWRVGLHGEIPTGGSANYTLQLRTFSQAARRTDKNAETRDNQLAWAPTVVGALPAGGFTLSGRCPTQRCGAFRVDLVVHPEATGAVESPRITAISYEFGVEPGRGKTPAGQKPSATT